MRRYWLNLNSNHDRHHVGKNRLRQFHCQTLDKQCHGSSNMTIKMNVQCCNSCGSLKLTSVVNSREEQTNKASWYNQTLPQACVLLGTLFFICDVAHWPFVYTWILHKLSLGEKSGFPKMETCWKPQGIVTSVVSQ